MTTPQDVASNLGRAWDAGDSVGMAAIFDVGADFVDVLGRRQKGREVIEREHRKLFESIYAGSTCAFRVIAARSLGEGVLLVHTASKLSVPSGPRQGDTFATQTMVMVGDLVTAFHNSVQTELETFTGEGSAMRCADRSGEVSSGPRDPTI